MLIEFFKRILNLNRNTKIVIVYLLDVILLISSLIFAIIITYNFKIYYNDDLFKIFLISFIISNVIFVFNGLYKNIFRFSSLSIVLKITVSILFYLLFNLIISYFLIDNKNILQIIIIHTLIYYQLILLSRYLMSYIYKSIFKIENRNILICGLGDELYQIVNYFDQQLNYTICGIIADDKNLARINNIKIFNLSNIDNLIKIKNVSEIYVSHLFNKSNLNYLFESVNIKIKKLPNLQEVSNSSTSISLINNIKIEDLLERPSVKEEQTKVFKEIYNSIVLITGGGGSIGSELSSKLLLQEPKKIILIENSELNLFEIQKKLNLIKESKNLNVEIDYYLNDIKDVNFLEFIFQNNIIDFLFHCAAYKHVHLSEENTITFLENNVTPTFNLSKLSIKYKIKKFVFISTDKAVRPTNIMGASKRMAELCVQYFSNTLDTKTIFSIVRFGNVLNSSGSVVPIFKEQINNGGPITVTHKNVVRYFMLIDEAVFLILNAFEIAKGGEVFVLNMSKQIKIYDLAKKMIKLSGLNEKNDTTGEGDIRINITGLRKGEKMYEELFIDENFDTNSKQKLFISKDSYLKNEKFKKMYDELNQYIIDKNVDMAIHILKNNIENYKRSNE